MNEHPVEGAIRIGFGLALLALVFLGPRTLWGLIGLLPLATGVMARLPVRCPARGRISRQRRARRR